jgi:ribosomal protein S18 acetylase RimI-like enzyme
METYYVKIGKENMHLSAVESLLGQTYWADERSIKTIEKSMENSICYGVFLCENDQQVGFARVITDYATSYYICDVIVDANYRGMGIGKKIIETILSDEEISCLRGILATRDAHELYRRYGFEEGGTMFMGRPRTYSEIE